MRNLLRSSRKSQRIDRIRNPNRRRRDELPWLPPAIEFEKRWLRSIDRVSGDPIWRRLFIPRNKKPF